MRQTGQSRSAMIDPMARIASVAAWAVGALAFLLGFTSCTGVQSNWDPYHPEREELQPWEDFEQQKADLWYAGMRPEKFEFEGQGSVTVKRWALQGWPGEEYVKIRLTYTNTTDQPMVHAFVWLEVLDADGQPHGSAAVRLFNPIGYSIWPGATVTTELRAPTNGIHARDGWGWGLACEAQLDEDPGEKPQMIVRPPVRGARGTPWSGPVRRSQYCIDRPGITSW